MITLGQITASDYNLLGAISEEEILGALDRATPAERKQFVRKVQNQTKQVAVTSNGPTNSRGEFEKRLHLLPDEIRQGLAKKNLQAVDTGFYSTKSVEGAKLIKMFQDDDKKVVGECNISSAKLEKGNLMLLSGIILLAGIAGQNQTASQVNFDILPEYIRNGEFEFKANGTTLIPKMSCEFFNSTGKNIQKGLFVLDNPKLILDQQAIEMTVEWGANAVEGLYMRVVLVGTSVTKY